MPILITRRGGAIEPFRNAEYIPFYYIIPQRILEQCGGGLNAIPRNPQEILRDRAVCDLIESDLFTLFLYDVTAYLVWPYMGKKEYMEIYSGYDPAWIFAHSPAYWVQEFIDEGIIPTAYKLLRDCNETLGYMSEGELDMYLRDIVPKVMEKYRMDVTMQVAEEFRCFEDFDFRNSREKTDFHRKWYHTRTKHPMISLEEFQENYTTSHNGQQWDEPDFSQNVEENVTAQILVEQFKATLSERDLDVLQMRMKGCTLKTIAEKLGYRNHSGVAKRIRKIGLNYEKFTGEKYGFEDNIITS